MKKKIVACLCAVAMLSSLVVGCGNNSEPEAAATVETENVAETESAEEVAQVAGGKEVTLRFSFWEPSTGKELENALEKVVESYNEIHPNVTIELVSQALSGYADWIKTQQAVNDLPEIVFNYAPTLISMYNAGVIENIAEELESPNPYNNNVTWKESFTDGALDAVHERRVPSEFNVPLYQTGVAMFYNKTLYDELGLTVPQNWDEYIANCEKIAETDYMPNAFMGQKKDAWRWLGRELTGGICYERWLADENINFNGDNCLSNYEVAKAVATGGIDFTTDKELQEDFKTYLKFAEEYVKYSPNASGLDEAAAKTLFLAGQAVHLNTGSWDIVGLLNNDEINFEVGVFPFPSLTKDNSEYAGKGVTLNGVMPVGVSNSVQSQEGAKEAAIDFLMYLTSPEQYAGLVTETLQIPTLKDVAVDDVFTTFVDEGYPLTVVFDVGDASAGKTAEEYLLDVIAGEKVELGDAAFEGMQAAIEAWCVTYCESNGLSEENDYNVPNLPLIN